MLLVFRNISSDGNEESRLSTSETIALYIVCALLIFLLSLLLFLYVAKTRNQIGYQISSNQTNEASSTGTTLYQPELGQITILSLTAPKVDIHKEKCVICLEDFRCVSHVRAGICLHPMHHICILRWIITNMKKHVDVIPCPICRTPFESFSTKSMKRTFHSHRHAQHDRLPQISVLTISPEKNLENGLITGSNNKE